MPIAKTFQPDCQLEDLTKREEQTEFAAVVQSSLNELRLEAVIFFVFFLV